jgi:hypothetical protein
MMIFYIIIIISLIILNNLNHFRDNSIGPLGTKYLA